MVIPKTAARAQAVVAGHEATAVVQGSVVAGQPGTPGAIPLPGVAITATDTVSGKRFAAATDTDGRYVLRLPTAGHYTIQAEFAAFAPVSQEVTVLASDLHESPGTGGKTTDFGMMLASRVVAAPLKTEQAKTLGPWTGRQPAPGAWQGHAPGGYRQQARGATSLSLQGSAEDLTLASGLGTDATTGLPSVTGIHGENGDQAVDTFAISGQTGQVNGLAGFTEDQLRDRIQQGLADARANGMLPPGADPTSATVGVLNGMMASGGAAGFGGGPGGPGGRGGPDGGAGGFGGGPGGGRGNFRNFNPTQLHGGFNYQGEYSTLDSAPWSPSLDPGTRTDYNRNSFGGSLAGSPYIPGLLKPSTKQFVFLNFSVARNPTPQVFTGTVPTALERGDITTSNPNGNAVFTGLSQTIYDPATGLPFANNTIPRSRISPQALAILTGYYPEPNLAASTQDYNYQTAATNGSDTDQLSFRFTRNLGQAQPQGRFGGRSGFGGGGGGQRGRQNLPPVLRQSISTQFAFSHTATDSKNIFLPLSGKTSTQNFNLVLGYTIGFGRFNNNASVTWNRADAETRNLFTDTTVNPNASVGIGLPISSPVPSRPDFYSGLSSIAINDFTSITNTSPLQTIGQTISFSDQVSWRHGKHNYRFGADLRRVHQDQLGNSSNALGTFTFTGYSTESPTDQCSATYTNSTGTCTPSASTTTTSTTPTSGYAFADFLLGLPQQTEIQAGLNKIYLREFVLDWYANDDWRVTRGLTINGGMRYEYFGPYSEKNGRLANITGVSSETTSVGCVTPNGISFTNAGGTVTCAAGPTSSLLYSDKSMYSPRLGVAYSPSFWRKYTKGTVIRAGYGINYNTSQFQGFARSLAYQAPFAVSQNNTLSTGVNPSTGLANTTGCNLQTTTAASNMTLASGFACNTKLYQNTFGVNPNYRLGMVQVYNLNLQRTLPMGVVLNFGYNGSHGDDLNVLRAPNHTPQTVTTPNAVAFTYADSLGESTFNALTVTAMKRMQKGVALNASYTYGHSIDDASSFGGASANSSIQNDADLHAERSNSSFDIRHIVTGSWVYELPVGPNRALFNRGGKTAKILDGFSISGTFTFASGSYLTPSYQSTASQTAAGGNFTLRPNRNFVQQIAGAGMLKSWFNGSAFSSPSTASYGTASRYSIEGPGQVLVNASLSRTVQMGGTRSFEGRVTAANVLNTVQYSGVNTNLSSSTYNQVTSAATMRQLTFVGRFRF